MPDKVRVGFIGVGQIAKHHLEAYSQMPDVDVVAAADIDAPELAAVAERFHIPSTYADFRKLLARDDIDAVDVCVHNNYHAPVTIEALKAGKHVYCEKPMAGSYADAAAMLETALQCGKKLSIQLGFVFARETKVAKHLIDAGRLGHLYHARSVGFRRLGRPWVDGYGSIHFVQKEIAAGGAVFDMAIYHVSQLLYLLGQPKIERITGNVYQEMAMDAGRREVSGYNVEELGTGYIRCADNLSIDLLEAWAIPLGGMDGSSISGSLGGVQLSPLSFHSMIDDMEVNSTFDLDQLDWRRHQLNPAVTAYDSPQHHWIAALQGRVDLLPTAEIALDTMLICEGIYLSHQLGREVTVEEVRSTSKSKALKI